VSRVEGRGAIDRSHALTFSFDGVEYTGYQGDTLASALLANDVRRVASSVALGRPRGIVAAGPEEPCAVVQIEEPFPEPMVSAPVIELYDGLVASSLAGQGRLATRPDPARYDALNAHCELLVVGGGLAGLGAAVDRCASGQRVVLLDDRPELGGWALDSDGDLAEVATAVRTLRARPNVRLLSRTTAFGYNDDNFVLAVQRRTNHLGAQAPAHVARERLWRIRAADVVLATGAHERLIAFADNDLPGVMLAGSARAYLHRYGVVAGQRAVVFTNNDSAYAAATDLRLAGVEILAVIDVRPQSDVQADVPSDRAQPGAAMLSEHVVVAASGPGQVESVTVAPRGGGAQRTFEADLLLVSGGWNPAVQLFSQAGGSTSWAADIAAFVPHACRQRVTVVGAAAGAGLPPVQPCWFVDAADPGSVFVDLQRDVTISDVRRATGTGMRSVEHVKRYTTAGTAHDQGKTSGLLTSAAVADALGHRIAEIGTTSARVPYVPVAFATLAGRAGRELLDPVRVSSIHDWHVAAGAKFEDVGQWKRPRFYPRPGEDLDSAVLRECAAARTGVAFMDVSTLGKIEVQGPDAAQFLDLIYTNLMSTLKVGAIRYGAMCHADGMIFDDGTVLRLGPQRFLLTTTTGNAAAVLDWLEEWHQTEWAHLRVFCTSVTEQWATVAVVGPKSRALLARLAPDLDVDNESFPFMTWRDGVVCGLDSRVCRISFSGELAYEINVAWTQGYALWQAIAAAGEPLRLTPYGTETMHVLRAEKGYPIIGQDTDGTVTPQDLGMGWVVSKKKPDFIGKRSHGRAANLRSDRKELVGLLPVDRSLRLREGTQLIATSELGAPPITMLGYVTSSYVSGALGRTFALALLQSGRERIGTQVYAAIGNSPVPVDVVGPVLLDPDGARRDG
jgi:sarcosine oxidase subunit alpha